MLENGIILSEEQQLFITKALIGNNILVDACIGSGKTTAIQQLCNMYTTDKKILYLTYNKLLKIDAKDKIRKKNVTVTNYHGFAFIMLKKAGISAAISDLIHVFLSEIKSVPHYDVLIIDEYQDIDKELSELLEVIKKCNPDIQIIAVGDMEQKIYDKSSLDIKAFINEYLEDYDKIEFTKSFRISSELAAMLGRVWHKTIIGTNENCLVEEMTMDNVVDFLAEQEPKDILCLGSRDKNLAVTLNILETRYPEKFNKNTVYASISERDAVGATEPKSTSAIFTTYDSSKGLERKICVIYDFTESYWESRIEKSQVSYEILRNIFCVAASRGKERIIFVEESDLRLSEKTLSTYRETNYIFKYYDISTMFDFKFKEDVEKCYEQLKISEIEQNDKCVIEINNKDGLIDLSPCIGIFQEAIFFDNYNIDVAILFKLMLRRQEKKYTEKERCKSLEEKILLLTALDTKQIRYLKQVEIPFITEEQQNEIVSRLQTCFDNDVDAQRECKLHFANCKSGSEFTAIGYADVVLNQTVYELKFVSELKHEHFLQCACYMIALKLEKGILWNTRNNTMYQIEIPNPKKFVNLVAKTITKGWIDKVSEEPTVYKQREKNKVNIEEFNMDNFAVIDTETTWSNRVMSIGIVIANAKTFEIVDSKYYLISPECKMPGMYSDVLRMSEINEYVEDNRKNIIQNIILLLSEHKVKKILAYNAGFDKSLLPELRDYSWYDIMSLAAYRQFNHKIPANVECYRTGKMKKGYGVESILRMLSGDRNYTETHNAYFDAMDEFGIVKLLGYGIEAYERGAVGNDEKSNNKTNSEIAYSINNKQSVRIEGKKYSKGMLEVAEVVKILGVSKTTIYNLIKRGELDAEKRRNVYLIPRESVNNYIKRK